MEGYVNFLLFNKIFEIRFTRCRSVSGFYKLKLIRCYLGILCEMLKHRSHIALRSFSYANRFEVAIFTLDNIGPPRKTLLRR